MSQVAWLVAITIIYAVTLIQQLMSTDISIDQLCLLDAANRSQAGPECPHTDSNFGFGSTSCVSGWLEKHAPQCINKGSRTAVIGSATVLFVVLFILVIWLHRKKHTPPPTSTQ